MSLGDLLYYIITDRPVKVLVPEHTEALRLIATMSNNINQLAHDANAAMMFGQYIPEHSGLSRQYRDDAGEDGEAA